MIKYLFFISLLIPISSKGQVVTHQTNSQTSGRFEIVQSTLLNRLMFKLDKYTGKTFQIVDAGDSTIVWQEVLTKKHFLSDLKNPGKINYQIFLSGFMAKLTLLININTGATWQLVQDDVDEVFWDPIK